SVRRDLRQPTEDQRQDDHREKGLQDHPADADGRLLVTHFDATPDQEVQQLPLAPDEDKVQSEQTLLWLDDGDPLIDAHAPLVRSTVHGMVSWTNPSRSVSCSP